RSAGIRNLVQLEEGSNVHLLHGTSVDSLDEIKDYVNITSRQEFEQPFKTIFDVVTGNFVTRVGERLFDVGVLLLRRDVLEIEVGCEAERFGGQIDGIFIRCGLWNVVIEQRNDGLTSHVI